MPQTYGFEQTRERRIPELGAVLHEYTHAKSGARLCWLECADENKSFCAAFKTYTGCSMREYQQKLNLSQRKEKHP